MPHLRFSILSCPFEGKCQKYSIRIARGFVHYRVRLQGCSSIVFFEARKKKDLYVWMSKAPDGPSVKFLATNGMLCLMTQLCGVMSHLEFVFIQMVETHRSEGYLSHPVFVVHTMAELKLSGNHLKGSRPVLSFHAVS
jgi:ribosome biogenesis protein BRX1